MSECSSWSTFSGSSASSLWAFSLWPSLCRNSMTFSLGISMSPPFVAAVPFPVPKSRRAKLEPWPRSTDLSALLPQVAAPSLSLRQGTASTLTSPRRSATLLFSVVSVLGRAPLGLALGKSGAVLERLGRPLERRDQRRNGGGHPLREF